MPLASVDALVVDHSRMHLSLKDEMPERLICILETTEKGERQFETRERRGRWGARVEKAINKRCLSVNNHAIGTCCVHVPCGLSAFTFVVYILSTYATT